MRTNSFKNYVSFLSRYGNSIWKPINSSRKPVLASPPLRLETPSPERWVKKRQRKSSCIRQIPRGHIPTARAGTRRRNAWIPGMTSPSNWTHKTYHTKGNKRQNRTLKYEKIPGMELITPKMLKELPRQGTVFLAYLFNAILRHQYWTHQLKLAEISLMPKPGKVPKDVKSYRPISLSPIIAKLLEKLILRRIDPDFTTSHWISPHQFAFRRTHSTIQQCHRITHIIHKAINNKEYCT